MTAVSRLWCAVTIAACAVMTTGAQSDSVVTVLNETYPLLEEQGRWFPIGKPGSDAGVEDKYGPDVVRKLTYVISEQSGATSESIFQFDDEGVLRTSQNVDRDVICANKETCTVDLTIQVGPADYFEIIQAQVEVIDTNDNAPSFTPSTIDTSLPENAPEGSVLRPIPAAEDPDSPRFAVQRYRLKSDTDLFELQVPDNPQDVGHVLLLLKGTLDREVEDSYTLTITAYDGSTPPLSGSVTVRISVTDINDNNPKFNQSTFTVNVDEDVQRNTVLLHLTAYDPDEGHNGDLVYSFSSHTESTYGQYFLLNGQTGDISVLGPLDYETVQTFILTVEVHNTDRNSLPATASVIVHVKDVNDNAPHVKVNPLGSSKRVEVLESGPANQTIATLTINDPDLGQGGDFDCFISNTNFSLEMIYPTNYRLLTGIQFDREANSMYNLSVTCEDAGDPVKGSVTYIPVYIMDINDHMPVFPKSVYVAHTEENKPEGSVLLTVTATDKDIGDNGEITYQLQSTVQDKLNIDPHSGVISVKVPLDREVQDQLSFNVTASDQGRPPNSVVASVVLTIADLDDNAPKFNQSGYTFQVTEHLAVDTYVGQVHADDADTDAYNKFTYVLQDEINDDNRFKIDENSGRIYARFSLDRETVAQYTLRVVAVPERSGTNSSVIVIIHVEDVNDHAPRFVFPAAGNHTVRVTSPLVADDVVVQLMALDDDAGRHGQVRYTIIGGNQDGYFYVNADSGDVTVIRDLPLGFEEPRVFNLSIEAGNIGGGSHLASSTYLVIIYNTTAFEALPSTGSSTKNRTAVIAIGVVFSVIAIILLVAILLLLHRQRQQKKQASRQRRCAPQPSAIVQPYVSTIERREDNQLIKNDSRDSDLTESKQAAYSNKALDLGEEHFGLAHMGHGPIQIDLTEPRVYQVRRVEAPRPRNYGHDSYGPAHRIVYQSEHTIHKPQVARPVVKIGQDILIPMSPLPLCDRDSDSGCSGLSHVADSGCADLSHDCMYGRRSSLDGSVEVHHPGPWHVPKPVSQSGAVFNSIPEHQWDPSTEQAGVHQDYGTYPGPSREQPSPSERSDSSRGSPRRSSMSTRRKSAPSPNRVTFQLPQQRPETAPVPERKLVKEAQV